MVINANVTQGNEYATVGSTTPAPATDTADKNTILARTKDIAEMVPYWDKTDAIVDGYEAVKCAGKEYLPKFHDEPEKDYETRLSLTKFTNIYRDVLEGLATKPFEEEIKVLGNGQSDTAPPDILDFCENVDGSGNSLTMFGAQTFFNGINSAVDWIFIDYPKADPAVVRTIADQKANNIRPFWSHVLGRNVLEVRSANNGGVEQLNYIRILEPGISTPPNVRIFERSGDVVTWQLWEQDAQKPEQYNLTQDGTLSIKVIPLVPFMTGRRDGKTWKFFPPMRDAADLQISLYQDESALQFIKTMAGYPMLAANGMKPQMGADGKTPVKLAIGPMKVLYGIPDNNGNHGQWSYIEPSATSMTFLQQSITTTKQDLRELGRQPLTAQSGQLTVITTAVAAGKARSAVSAWALALKDALENALTITAMWMNMADYEPEVNVYTEFDDFTDGGADLVELGAGRRAGDISLETYWTELQRRGVLSPEFDIVKEKENLLNDIPSENNGLIDPPAPVVPPKTKPATQPPVKKPAAKPLPPVG